MSLLIYLKPTNYCNVGCEHCYLPESVRAEKKKMSLEDLEASARFIKDIMDRNRIRSAHIVWHGGEPLTMSPDWFFLAGEILDNILPDHSESIQTSMIPYTKRHANLVKTRFGNHVGSSIDFSGLRTINGSASAYQKLWLDKVALAREDEITVVPGMVPSKQDIHRAREILAWFVDNDFHAFNVDRYNQFHGCSPNRPTNSEHARFLIDLFDATMGMMEKKGVAPKINVVDAPIRGILFGVGGDRWGGNCQSRNIVINPDGKTNSCPDRIDSEEAFSFVRDGSEKFLGSALRRRWIRIQAYGHGNGYCNGCRYYEWCKTACPLTENDLSSNAECAGYRTYLDHVASFLQSAHGESLAVAYLG